MLECRRTNLFEEVRASVQLEQTYTRTAEYYEAPSASDMIPLFSKMIMLCFQGSRPRASSDLRLLSASPPSISKLLERTLVEIVPSKRTHFMLCMVSWFSG
jgi:hypothetical protein